MIFILLLINFIVKIKQLLYLVSFICLFYACSHEIAVLNPDYIVGIADTIIIPPKDSTVIGFPKDTTINTCNPDSVYFASQFFPLMLSSCAMSECHDAITKADGIVLTDYTNIMKIVKSGDPANSKLYKFLIDSDPEDRMPMAPVPPFTQNQINLV